MNIKKTDHDNRFTGDLVITIDPGIEITIPNHELVRSFVDIDATTGQEYISDSSKRVMGLYAEDSQTANTMIAFGRTFLTGAYLMVDADKQQFTIWKGQTSFEQKLIAHGPSLCPDAASISSPTSALASSSSFSKGSGLTISKSAIAGTSVVLFSVLAAGIGAVYFLVRKGKKAQARQNDDKDTINGKHASLESDDSPFQKSELAADRDHQPPQEMSTGRHTSAALAPYEMNGSNHLPTKMAAPKRFAELAANEESALEKGIDFE